LPPCSEESAADLAREVRGERLRRIRTAQARSEIKLRKYRGRTESTSKTALIDVDGKPEDFPIGLAPQRSCGNAVSL